jgi:hypothetical protein
MIPSSRSPALRQARTCRRCFEARSRTMARPTSASVSSCARSPNGSRAPVAVARSIASGRARWRPRPSVWRCAPRLSAGCSRSSPTRCSRLQSQVAALFRDLAHIDDPQALLTDLAQLTPAGATARAAYATFASLTAAFPDVPRQLRMCARDHPVLSLYRGRYSESSAAATSERNLAEAESELCPTAEVPDVAPRPQARVTQRARLSRT